MSPIVYTRRILATAGLSLVLGATLTLGMTDIARADSADEETEVVPVVSNDSEGDGTVTPQPPECTAQTTPTDPASEITGQGNTTNDISNEIIPTQNLITVEDTVQDNETPVLPAELPSSWTANLEISSASIITGESVTVTPLLDGADAEGFTYNYVWNYEGAWEDWGSTLRGTGARTLEASWTFTPSKAGRYELYVDVTDPAGNVQTVRAQVTVEPAGTPRWNASIQTNTQDLALGQSVTVTPLLDGADAEGFTYNYVWCRNGSWDEGQWGSTILETGAHTSSDSWDFKPTQTGCYTLFVDVKDTAGNTRTISTTVTVTDPSWLATIDLSSDTIGYGSSVTVTPRLVGSDAAGFTYNYVWNYEGAWEDWGSTLRDVGEKTAEASWTFTPSKAGRYELYVDVTDPLGNTRTLYTKVAVEQWNSSISVGSSSIKVGDTLNMGASLNASNTAGFTYNYVWSYEDSWSDGDWDSTVHRTGSTTPETTWQFQPTKAGLYHLFVDVIDASGMRETHDAYVYVSSESNPWELRGLTTSASRFLLGNPAPLAFTPQTYGNLTGVTYRYTWSNATQKTQGEIEADGISALWLPSETGRYTVTCTATSVDGTQHSQSVEIEVVNALQLSLIEAAERTPFPGYDLCAGWVCDAFDNASGSTGFLSPRLEGARDYYFAYCNSSDLSTLQTGMLVAVPESGRTHNWYGHIGIYAGDGMIMHSANGVERWTLADWIKTYTPSWVPDGTAKWGWMLGRDLSKLQRLS